MYVYNEPVLIHRSPSSLPGSVGEQDGAGGGPVPVGGDEVEGGGEGGVLGVDKVHHVGGGGAPWRKASIHG